ncbi:MAG TPA: type II secretion system protein GspM [Minicystis sp.]|nr:type II secretion system protein GspM [Minicystis sp.]
MSLRARFEKLEPRERRLLTILGGILGAALFLLLPIGIWSMVSSRRSDNEDLRALIDQIYDTKSQVAERRAKHDALLARYAKPAPPLAGFLDEIAKAQGITAAESQDRPEAPHGKRYGERLTVVKMHKVSLLPLVKMLEKIEQSGYPVAVTKLSIKPRTGEPDSYEVELGVSAFDRKADAHAPAGASSAKAAASASAGPEEDL